MRLLLTEAEDLLRNRGAAPMAGRRCVLIVLVASPLYGLAMGSFSVSSPERIGFAISSAVKLPALILVSAVVCLPAFFVVNAAAGLREDFRVALRAIAAAQAGVAIALCALSPVLLVLYSGIDSHETALRWNMGVFTLAALVGQIVMLRRYRPLIRRDRRHRLLLAGWLALYAFVGIQMAWTLRPFVGTPGTPFQVFREGAFTNAYVVVWRTVFG